MKYVLEFGPEDKTVDGKSLENERDAAVLQSQMLSRRPLTDQEKEFSRLLIKSQRDSEKDILKQLAQLFTKAERSLDVMVEVQDLLREIKSAPPSWVVKQREIDIFRKGFAQIKEEVPAAWFSYADIFRQIKEPVRKSEEQADSKPTKRKDAENE